LRLNKEIQVTSAFLVKNFASASYFSNLINSIFG